MSEEQLASMNLWDNIGRMLRTNHVEIGPEVVRKEYRDFSLPMLWGFLERKPYLSARDRYQREKKLMPKFFESGLNTPELLSFDDMTLRLDMRGLELTDLVEVFRDPRIHRDDKLGYFEQALRQLQGIHGLGESHGDAYLKNFFRLDRQYPERGPVFTCDFEFRRASPDEQATDVLMLVADAAHLLENHHKEGAPAAFSLANEVYGKHVSFPFDARDRIFFRARFGMNRDFFECFGRRKLFYVDSAY